MNLSLSPACQPWRRLALCLPALLCTLFASRSQARPSLTRTLPFAALRFEPNRGQAASGADWLARGPGCALTLNAQGVTFALRTPEPKQNGGRKTWDSRTTPPAEATRSVRLTMALVGVHAHTTSRGEDALPGRVNYLRGNRPSCWQRAVPQWGQVRYQAVYPGIDLLYHAAASPARSPNRLLEYDFVVAPHADPQQIGLRFAGAANVQLDCQGNLHVALPALKKLKNKSVFVPDLVWNKPVCYQEIHGQRKTVTAAYRLTGSAHDRVQFALGRYNHSHPLVIDPTWVYATYLGGSNEDSAADVAVDAGGNAYITGATLSNDFAGAVPRGSSRQDGDAWVAKIGPTGTLLWVTYLGGTRFDAGTGIAVTADGSAVVTGSTSSNDFPGLPARTSTRTDADAWVCKLTPNGAGLVYVSRIGGTGSDYSSKVALDSAGGPVVVGSTSSRDLAGATPRTRSDADLFVARLSPDGATALYVRYLGGTDSETAGGLALDAQNNVVVIGTTLSNDLPGATPRDPSRGDADAFYARLDSNGTLVHATYVGGTNTEEGVAVALDADGNLYLAGYTGSDDFPVTQSPYGPPFGGGEDAFLVKISPDNHLVYATYLGGSDHDEATGVIAAPGGVVYLLGNSYSSTFPGVADIPGHTLGTPLGWVARIQVRGAILEVQTTYPGGLEDTSAAFARDNTGLLTIVGQTRIVDYPGTPGRAEQRTDADAILTRLQPAVKNDFGGNGSADLIWQNFDLGAASLWLFDGPAYSSSAYIAQGMPTAWRIVGTGDFNRDGQTDLVWSNSQTNEVVVWLMNGNVPVSTVSLSGPGVLPSTWNLVGVADFDRDGYPDLLWQNGVTNETIIWNTDGTRPVASQQLIAPGTVPTNTHLVAAAVLTGDRRVSLIWQDISTNETFLWYLDGLTVRNAVRILPGGIVSPDWRLAAVADIGGDGNPDFLWQNAVTNQLFVWYMNNGTVLGAAELLPANTVPTVWQVVGPRG